MPSCDHGPIDPWPFDQPPHCASFTTRQVLADDEPILFVSHDADDHGWQFIGSSAEEEDCRLVCLESMVRRDPSVLELADLPPGWHATRPSPSSPWKRQLSPRREGALACLAHDGYELEAIAQTERDSYRFPLPQFPTEEERTSLQEGNLVKLIFRYPEYQCVGDAQIGAERMWVLVSGRDNEHFVGTLDSDPRHTDRLRSGDLVRFEPSHVIEIWRGTE
ncbi:MAG: DUF2314 domain-containing protein [Verrucomicrobia bacterium]|nr:DUF2314 domain-containing protein [Verrucomicrobiota bacterium]